VEIDLALPGAPLAVTASADRLGQVVENLLDNAIGFSVAGGAGGGPAGGGAAGEATVGGSTGSGGACAGDSPLRPRVGVELAREDGLAVVAVTDSGPGIPAEHQGRIFDRFFTYRPGEDGRRAGHTGLGLAIAKAIVEGYGGSIAAANRPGGGARFEVRLPLAG
jgi:signal transduction histidine kinase